MNKETLLAELNRLLDAGEPLLDVFPNVFPNVFPKQHPDDWLLLLPDNISPEMERYADDVAFRALNRKKYQGYRLLNTPGYLAGLVKQCEAGLLGWRAIGVLK